MNDLNRSLKTHNLKLTAARQIVFDALEKSKKALSPKEIFSQVSQKTDMVSVYRNLSLFSEIGLAHKFQDGRYSLCQHKHDETDARHHHVHVMMNCSRCGLTQEIEEHSKDLCDIASRLKKYSQPIMDFQSLVLQGLCDTCSSHDSSASSKRF